MTNLGLIQVYTGNGKGKTTASLGLAFRACGHGYKVLMIQFMKDDPNYGEVQSAKYLPGFTMIPVGRNDFVDLAKPDKIDIDLAQQGWEKAKRMIMSEEYDIVILDEINIAMACGLISTDEVAKFLLEKPANVELILTGRYCPDSIIDIADLVTEMTEHSHPFQQGIHSREGIEF